MEEEYDDIKKDCWEKSFHAKAVSYIYQTRARKISKWLNISKVTGFVIPVLIGGIVTSSLPPDVLKYTLIITSPIAILQLVASTVLTVSNKENNYTEYTKYFIKNNMLCYDFEQLAKFSPPLQDIDIFKSQYNILCEREKGLIDVDDLSDKEKRMGMRYALRDNNKSCIQCNKIPYSMTPSNCDVCGNF